jgi:hypothetical protein
MRARLIAFALALAVTAGLAAALRFGLIESERAAECAVIEMPWWCTPRWWVVWLFLHHGLGIVAIATGVLAFVRPRLPLIALGAAAAGPALVLYNTEMGAVGLLLTLLSVLRGFSASR